MNYITEPDDTMIPFDGQVFSYVENWMQFFPHCLSQEKHSKPQALSLDLWKQGMQTSNLALEKAGIHQ